MPKIGIDPGHGGRDPGAVGPGGLPEKTVNLDVALQLCRILRDSGLETVITRDGDVERSLAWRADFLNKSGCNLVVSVHCNSDDRPASYVATFIIGEGGSAQQAATLIQEQLVKVTGWPDGGIRVENFQILRDTTAPAVLVEMGFISNPSQEMWLSNASNRAKLARAIAQGVCNFFGEVMVSDWKGHMHEKEIQEAISLGIMAGYPDGSFAPDKPCTRAELATVAVRTYYRVLNEIIIRLTGKEG